MGFEYKKWKQNPLESVSCIYRPHFRRILRNNKNLYDTSFAVSEALQSKSNKLIIK